jgi:hypothetical protein
VFVVCVWGVGSGRRGDDTSKDTVSRDLVSRNTKEGMHAGSRIIRWWNTIGDGIRVSAICGGFCKTWVFMTCLILQSWLQSYAYEANLFFCFMLMQNYFSCFFPLPIVISSLRWGLEAGRKTVVSPIKLFTFFFLLPNLYSCFLKCLTRWLLSYCYSHYLAL